MFAFIIIRSFQEKTSWKWGEGKQWYRKKTGAYAK